MSALTSLAFYLPQFHEIPENDEWWGKGFTEWENLRAARKWSESHVIRRPIQPLGEYSLIDAATLEQQWALASKFEIDGFAVWDYWFGGGRQLLEKPIELVLRHRLNFKYCLAWANHSWMDKSRNLLLCEQQYLGHNDYELYFNRLCQHFETDNYIKIDDRPVFIIFNPYEIPDFERFTDQWRAMAERRGFPGIYLVADRLWDDDSRIGLVDKYSNSFRFMSRRNKLFINYAKEYFSAQFAIEFGPRNFDFRRLEKDVIPRNITTNKFVPTAITGWDTTPRHGRRGVVFENLDPAAFRRQLDAAAAHFEIAGGSEHVLFLKSWNEWAEGNILEPDSVFGSQFLETFKEFRTCWTAGQG
ncbi:MAG: glycoside hydrolase family 99-like domain-containing protein [Kineosporiaceae bacterium]|nr:glycoside hydrolase family 99-like domain-containing protein [Aeromicrobium sp.]